MQAQQYKVFYDPRNGGAIKGISPISAPTPAGVSHVVIDEAFAKEVFSKKVRLKDYYVKSTGVVEPELQLKSAEHDTVATWHAWLQHPNNYLSHYDVKIKYNAEDEILKVYKSSSRVWPYPITINWVSPELSSLPICSHMPGNDMDDGFAEIKTHIDPRWIPTVHGEFGTLHYEYID